VMGSGLVSLGAKAEHNLELKSQKSQGRCPSRAGLVNYQCEGKRELLFNGFPCDKVASPKWHRIVDGEKFGVASTNLPSASRSATFLNGPRFPETHLFGTPKLEARTRQKQT